MPECDGSVCRRRSPRRDALEAGTHLCLATPNATIQEGVRAYYGGWYRDVRPNLPSIEKGYVAAPSGPGLGTRLLPDCAERADVMVRVSER